MLSPDAVADADDWRFWMLDLESREAEPLDDILDTTREYSAFGAGDALRFSFTPWLLGKASYEYALRLPNSEELFGDGVFVLRNSDLRPERSHNFNLGPRLELKQTSIGDLIIDVNGFWRETTDQIVLIASADRSPNRNIADMRTRGVEGSLYWRSPGQWLILDGSVTFMRSLNISAAGPFEAYKGMRIPNRPDRFASWGARFHTSGVLHAKDTLDIFYSARWVAGFYRGWDVGNPKWKMSVPGQLGHAVGITSAHRAFWGSRFSFTFEIDNVTDAQLFDVFGVQRPGRSYNVKIWGQL